jgi:hypothetical protein
VVGGGYSPPVKAAVHTSYGPPDVVRISEVPKPTAGDNEVLVRVHATTVNRTDCGFRAAKPFFVRFFTGLRRPRVTVLGNEFAGGRGGRRRRHVLRGRRPGVRVQRGLVRCPCRIHGDCRSRVGCDHAGEPDLREGRSRYRGFALCPLVDQEGEDPERAGRPRQRRHRCHRLGGGPAPEASGRQRDRGPRHEERGAGQGPGRGQGDRLHGPGLHEGRADLRRGPRCGRQELVRPLQATVETGRDLPVLGSGSAVPESAPGAHHTALRRQEGHVPPSEGGPGDGLVFQGTDRVRSVQAAHRQVVPVGPDRRGLQLCRDGPENRQCRDQRLPRSSVLDSARMSTYLVRHTETRMGS